MRLSVAAPRHFPPPVGANQLQVGGHARRPSVSSVRSHGTNADRRSIVSSVRGGVRDSVFVKPPGIRSSLRGAPTPAAHAAMPQVRSHDSTLESRSLGRSSSSRSRAVRVSHLNPPPDAFKSPSAVSLPLSKTHSAGSHDAAPSMHFHMPPRPVATTRPGLVQRAGSESDSYGALPLGASAVGFARPGPPVALSREPSSSNSSNDTVLSNRFALSDSTTNLTGDGSGGASTTHVRSHPLEPYRPLAPGRVL